MWTGDYSMFISRNVDTWSHDQIVISEAENEAELRALLLHFSLWQYGVTIGENVGEAGGKMKSEELTVSFIELSLQWVSMPWEKKITSWNKLEKAQVQESENNVSTFHYVTFSSL